MIVRGRVYSKHERSIYAPVCVTLLVFILSSYFLFLRISSQAGQIITTPTPRSYNDGNKSISVANERILRKVSRPLSTAEGRRYIIATAGTYSYREHLSNLACSLSASENKSRVDVLLLSLDSRLYRAAAKLLPSNVHTILSSDNRVERKDQENNKLTQFGTPAFASLSRRKLAAVRDILTTGYDVMFFDGDVAFCDAQGSISTIESLVYADEGSDIIAQRAWVRGQVFNTGLYYARANERTISLLKAAEDMESSNPRKALDDQVAMNQMACEQKHGGKKLRSGCLWRNETKISIFPNDTSFPLGCTLMENGKQLRRFSPRSVRELCRSRKVALVHYSCWGGDAKKPSMRSRGMWFVNEQTTSQCTGS